MLQGSCSVSSLPNQHVGLQSLPALFIYAYSLSFPSLWVGGKLAQALNPCCLFQSSLRSHEIIRILRAFCDANQAFHSNFNWIFGNSSIIGNNSLYPCRELYTLCVVCASPPVTLLLSVPLKESSDLLLCTWSSSIPLGLFSWDLLTQLF